MNNTKTEQVITAPIASIIITLTICLTVLFASGVFDKSNQDYATVNFDGGYKKIGVISEQRNFSIVEVKFNDEVLWSGSLDYVAGKITESIASEQAPQNVTWKEGITLKGTAGISWVGSESSFELTTESIDLISTKAEPLVVQGVVSQLLALDRKIKDEHNVIAKQALTFSEAPSTSFTFIKLIEAIRNL